MVGLVSFWRDVLQKGCEKVGGNGLVLFGEMVRLYTIQWLGFGLGDGRYAVVGPELRQSCQSASATKKWSCWRSMSKSKFELMDQLIRAQTRFGVEGTREPDQTTASKVRAFVTRRQLPPNILPMFKGCFNLFKKHRSSLCKTMPSDNCQKVYSQCLHRSKQWHGKCSFPLWNLRSR